MSLANTINTLFSEYGHLKGVTIECQKELVAIGIKNQEASAEVFLQGAQVTRYQPNGKPSVLFLSQSCSYRSGQALRGGIPICWPWFGDATKNPTSVQRSLLGSGGENSSSEATRVKNLPAHGFVREREWEVISIRTPADDLTIIELSLDIKDEPLWPFDTLLSYRIAIGKTLSVSLHVQNQSDHQFTYSGALHTYLSVDDITQTRISGLSDCHYYDALESSEEGGWLLKKQEGDIQFSQETDRVYRTQGDPIRIHDGKDRALQLASTGSQSVVVWNPWIDKSRQLSQFSPIDYKQMVCVETANVMDDVVTLAPDESHRIELVISA